MAGIVGAAYFMYGRKQGRIVPMIAGVLLGIYPWFFDSVIWLLVVGALLVAAPFVIDY
jgi:hypothetical protein